MKIKKIVEIEAEVTFEKNKCNWLCGYKTYDIYDCSRCGLFCDDLQEDDDGICTRCEECLKQFGIDVD